MSSDAKLGLVIGVGLVLTIAVVFFRKDPAKATSPAEPGAPAAVKAANSPPPVPPSPPAIPEPRPVPPMPTEK